MHGDGCDGRHLRRRRRTDPAQGRRADSFSVRRSRDQSIASRSQPRQSGNNAGGGEVFYHPPIHQGNVQSMPRERKAPRLWYRKERLDANGKLISRGTWLILAGGRHFPTGCALEQEEAAKAKLAEHVVAGYRAPRREQDIEQIDVAQVLAIFDEDTRDTHANMRLFDASIVRLTKWWGGKMLAEVTGETCRAYVKSRGKSGGARRDLEDLRAAINHHAKEGLHRGVVRVSLPDKGRPRERWLSRGEVAKLLWFCWRARETQMRHRGRDKGKELPTKKRPLQHVARFTLLGIYTGTRAAAIATASPHRAAGRSWVDLDKGIFYRLAEGKKATNKRQTPVRLPAQLLGHMRRWRAADERAAAISGIEAPTHFIEWNGRPIESVKTGFRRAAIEAGLMTDNSPVGQRVTPHTLRHTAATWLMQNGTDLWEAAGFLGMSPEILQKVYGHHHPDFQKGAAAGFRPKK